ncbi:MAG: SRPBCC family protein [Streptosporangiaceae bacterium]
MNDPTAPAAELVFTRAFEAPRELVFQCMTQPEHLTHFWGPAGTSAPIELITVDARPGGAFETVMINDADGSRYPTRAVFDEVVEPERLVWTETHSGMTVTVTFTDLGGSRTGVEIRQARVPEAFRSPEAQAGFLTSLDRFAGYLATLTAGPGAEESR